MINTKNMQRDKLVALARAYYIAKETCKSYDQMKDYKHYLKCFMELTDQLNS